MSLKLLNLGTSQSNGKIPTDFNAAKGIWEYNFSSKEITKTGASDKIIVKFPVSTNLVQNTGVNNCTYTVYQLTTVLYTNTSQWGRTDTLVTRLLSDLYLSGSKVMDMNYACSYQKDQISKLDATYTLGDYTYQNSFEQISALALFPKYSFKLQKGSSTLYQYSILPVYKGDSLQTTEYAVTVGDIQLNTTMNYAKYFKMLLNSQYATITQKANDSLLVSDYEVGTLVQPSTGSKLGDLRYLRSKVSPTGCACFYNYKNKRVILYADGTYQDLASVFSSLQGTILKFILFDSQ